MASIFENVIRFKYENARDYLHTQNLGFQERATGEECIRRGVDVLGRFLKFRNDERVVLLAKPNKEKEVPGPRLNAKMYPT